MGGACIFYPYWDIKNRVYPFSEIPINTSSDMVLGCGFSFLRFFSKKHGPRFEKVKFWFFLEGGICFFDSFVQNERPET